MYVRTTNRRFEVPRAAGQTTVKPTQVAVPSLSPLHANSNDVFLGRGGVRTNHFFRKRIRVHAKKYYELRNGRKKDFIVFNIVEPIIERAGKFYTHNPADEAGVWRIGLYDEIIKKIRGALTDYWKKILEYNDGKEYEEDKEDEEVETAANPGTGTKRKATDSCDSRPTIIPNKQLLLNGNTIRQNSVQKRTLDTACSEETRVTHETMVGQVPPLAVPKANNTPPRKTNIYLNEKKGYLLNVTSRENLYLNLLIRHADAFQERFGGSDPIDVLWNDDGRIRFVWDNVVSELQRTNFHIVLCPESQKSIDVDPKDLQLPGQDPKHIDITFRTIRCITAALSDHEYIASEKRSIQSKQKQNRGLTLQSSNNDLRRESMQLNVDELHRAMKHEELNAGEIHRARQHEERVTMLQSPRLRKPQHDAAMVLPGQIPQTVAAESAYVIPSPTGMIQQKLNAACHQHQIALQQHPSSPERTPDYLRLLQMRMQAQTQMQNALTTRYAAQTGLIMERERQIGLMKRVIRMSENSTSNRNPHTTHVQAHQAVQAAFNQSRNAPPPIGPSKWQSPVHLAQALSEIKTTSHTETWDRHYRELLEYYLEHGDLRVPQHYGKDPTLGRFVTSVRYLRREKRRGGKRQLEENREVQLEKIGFPWELQKPVVPQYRKERLATEWFILKEYGRTHQGIRVPLGLPKYSWLAYWVEARRLAAEDSNEVWDEAKLMLKLGFEWVCPAQYRQQQQRQEMFVSQQQRHPRRSPPLSNWQQQQITVQEPQEEASTDDHTIQQVRDDIII
jgi:hypothetical protein